MFDNVEVGNVKRSFDVLQSERLGLYVYALVDPRDNKVFYVGQGRGGRIFDHFNDAQRRLNGSTSASSKEIRILDIWKNAENVKWQIIAHKLTEACANATEAALIDALSISPNGPCLNSVRGPHSSMLSEGEVTELGATPIDPTSPLSRVFVFPVHNALSDSADNVYQATRASWSISDRHQSEGAYAVGIKNGISVGSFVIDRWEPHGGKFAFVGDPESTLLNFDWKPIIAQASGYWQWGNYLIVEFDGSGKFRFIRGSSEHDWLSL